MADKVYSGEIDLIGPNPTVVGTTSWYVGETRQGWTGFANINPGDALTEEEKEAKGIFTYATNRLVPGAPINFGLWGRPANSDISGDRGVDVNFVRSWPSVITSVYAPIKLDEGSDDMGAMVLFSDPVTYWLDTPVWGVFKNRSPGELLAGGLMLAAGISGEPTLNPSIPGAPLIRISETLSEDVTRIPYAIATGEKLSTWLGAIFGRLGIRMEMLGEEEDFTLRISLLTDEPSGDVENVVDMVIQALEPSATGAVISAIRQVSPDSGRSALIDNPSIGAARWIGSSPTVGRLYTATGLTLDQATLRNERVSKRSAVQQNTLTVVTRQPGLHPGRIVSFDQPISGAVQWQLNGVSHAADDGQYRNQADLLKLGIWTPSLPADRGIVVLGATVHKPDTSQDGEKVERDLLSRIPVRLCCDQGIPSAASAPDDAGGADDETQPAAEPADPGPSVELTLPVVCLMAGGHHGFMPEHRHGDLCQVVVHHPLSAEIIGFTFSDCHRVDDRFVDVSMGILADVNLERWSGIVFRPGKEVEKEEEEEEQKWRQGEGI